LKKSSSAASLRAVHFRLDYWALESRTPIFHDPTIAQLARYWSTPGKRFGEAQGTTSKPVVAQLIERLARADVNDPFVGIEVLPPDMFHLDPAHRRGRR
jgi:hypothetical protein